MGYRFRIIVFYLLPITHYLFSNYRFQLNNFSINCDFIMSPSIFSFPEV